MLPFGLRSALTIFFCYIADAVELQAGISNLLHYLTWVKSGMQTEPGPPGGPVPPTRWPVKVEEVGRPCGVPGDPVGYSNEAPGEKTGRDTIQVALMVVWEETGTLVPDRQSFPCGENNCPGKHLCASHAGHHPQGQAF